MNSKALALFTPLMFLSAASSARVLGCQGGDIPNGCDFSESTVESTLFPTLAPTETTRGNNPLKGAFLRLAAQEAAVYLDNGEIGPNLDELFKSNADLEKTEVVNQILEAAKNL